MACPFVRRDQMERQPSTVELITTWNLEEDPELSEADNALSLRHLNAAIQLLTAPSNDDVLLAVKSLKAKFSEKWPIVAELKTEKDEISIYPHFDYLADIQDTLLAKVDELTTCDILVQLGKELIATCCTGVVERAFCCLGADVQEFLSSLDGVYDVLKLQEEDITETGFVCAGEGELIFTSERTVIAWLLLGSLKAICAIIYDADPKIEMEPIEGEIQQFRYLFTLPAEEEEKVEESGLPADLRMNNATFCKAFPWHFIMNENLDLVQLGVGFSRLFRGYINTNARSATIYFRFKRPRGLALNFKDIVRRTNTTFLISLRAPRPDFYAKGLEIKGQMVHCRESNTLLFLGSPALDGLEGLTTNGLFISDIPLHDATREVILVGEQARAQDGLRRRMDKLKNSIEVANAAVEKERKKNVELLHLIFPAEIAERLWLGAEIEAKPHEDITLLFSDIVGFTSICSTATPLMVVTMLERLYKSFDEFCGRFDVYKVETIGDAYCVASGLQHGHARPFDAHRVAWMALAMIDACGRHNTHQGQNIRMRVGLHTGTVLAGVVGRKMPRYCLFGHNVTIANKFESGSLACRVNVSPTTRDFLTEHDDFRFILTPREPDCLPKEFPDKEGKTCYFLDGYKHAGVDESEPLLVHIEAAMKAIKQ